MARGFLSADTAPLIGDFAHHWVEQCWSCTGRQTLTHPPSGRCPDRGRPGPCIPDSLFYKHYKQHFIKIINHALICLCDIEHSGNQNSWLTGYTFPLFTRLFGSIYTKSKYLSIWYICILRCLSLRWTWDVKTLHFYVSLYQVKIYIYLHTLRVLH